MKDFRFEFSPNAERAFAHFDKGFQNRVLDKLEFFEKSGDPLRLAKKLKGLDNIYRFRMGDYRILVQPKENGNWVVLVILKIGHRRAVYE